MHLTGETDAGDCVSSDTCVAQSPLHGQATGSPPILRILLCPPGTRRYEIRVLLGPGCNNSAMLVDDQSPRSAGANIDPKK
jgi:hypothetical protein